MFDQLYHRATGRPATDPSTDAMDAGRVNLDRVVTAVGPGLLHLVRAPHGTSVPVSCTSIHDPQLEEDVPEGALVLGVGTRPADAHGLLDAIGRQGGCGLVLKRYGDPTESLTEAADSAGVALLVIDDELGWDRIGALLHTALAVPARRGSGAESPAVGDLFELANAIASSVGGAVAIEDVNRHVLAYSTWPEYPIDDERRAGILSRAVPAGPENDEHYRELYSENQVCRFTTGSPTPRLAAPVRAGSELLGSLWVIDADGTFGLEARRALSDAADLASLHLLRARASDDLSRRQRGDLLRRLLETPTDDVLVARQLGLPTDTPVLVAAFAVAPDENGTLVSADTTSHLVDLVSLHCEARYGRHGCVLIDGTVYALLPSSTGSHRAPLEQVARHARNAVRMPVLAGIGSVVPGLRHAARSRHDADMTLRVLTSGRYPEAVASIEDMHAAVAFLELADQSERLPFTTYSPATDVHAYDRERGTDYAATLLAYFESDGNIATMSERLRVHPNTSRYRLGRAQDVFGLDLTDPDTRLLLWLQLRLDAA